MNETQTVNTLAATSRISDAVTELPVHRGLGDLGEILNQLTDQVGMLTERLAPVLGADPSEPSKLVEANVVEGGHSIVWEQIQDLQDRAAACKMRLAQLVMRLEV